MLFSLVFDGLFNGYVSYSFFNGRMTILTLRLSGESLLALLGLVCFREIPRFLTNGLTVSGVVGFIPFEAKGPVEHANQKMGRSGVDLLAFPSFLGMAREGLGSFKGQLLGS